jgi:hypothetical protein
MTSRMNIYERVKIFNTIAAIPIAERETVIKEALLFMISTMDVDDIVNILRSVAAIPVAERQDVVQQALFFFLTLRICNNVRARVICAIAGIPIAERQAVIQQVLSITPQMSESTTAGVFAVVAIPVAERASVVRYALLLMTPKMNEYERVEILRAVAEIPVAERGIVCQQMTYLTTPQMEFSQVRRILRVLVAIPSIARSDVIQQVLFFMTSRTSEHDIEMALGIEHDIERALEVISQIPVAVRAIVVERATFLTTPQMDWPEIETVFSTEIENVVAERENVVRAQREQVRQVATQMNVHTDDRDGRTRLAFELLYGQQGPIESELIDQANREFVAFLNASSRTPQQKRLAQVALEGTPTREVLGEEFGPLIEEADFALSGFLVSGKELFGRLWIFASKLPENEKMHAKEGMITELVGSYNFNGTRICNQGKAQRLALAVLQGNLPGAVIEEVRAEEIPPTADMALQEFFTIEAHKKIEELPALITAVNQFCNARRLITPVIREEFLRNMREYARVQGME